MLFYLAMLAVPGLLALTGSRRAGLMLFVVALAYWVIIGFRFQVGMDWNNYIFIYEVKKSQPLGVLLVSREPGYGVLTWLAANLGGGTIFLNAVSALLFCWGLFTVARRCAEPWLAIVVATPLVVVAFAMSGARQSLAAGIIYYLFATWEERRTAARVAFVLIASLFHFSAVFVLAFVALASRAPPVLKVAATVIMAAFVFAIVRFAPDSMESYSRLYVGTESRLNAPGAVVQVGVIASAAALYLIGLKTWRLVIGEDPLIHNIAWATIGLLLAIPISSVGAYRFGLYLWPMVMYVVSAAPMLIAAPVGRAFYRLVAVMASFAMMIGWLTLANNSLPWIPYKSWLLQPDGVRMIRDAEFKR